MVVQDLIISAANLLFTVLLVPTLRDTRSKVPVWTSAPTGCALLVEAAVFLSLHFELSCITTVASGSMWIAIALLRGTRAEAPAGSDTSKSPTVALTDLDRNWIEYWKVVRQTTIDLDRQIQTYEIQMFAVLSALAVLAFTLVRLIPTDLYSLALGSIAEAVAMAGVIVSVALSFRVIHFFRLLKGAVATGEAVEVQLFSGKGVDSKSPLFLTHELSRRAGLFFAAWTPVLVAISFDILFVLIIAYAVFKPSWL